MEACGVTELYQDDLLDMDFYTKAAHISAWVDKEIPDLTTAINLNFDDVRYAGLGDSGRHPVEIDLNGFTQGVPYTITLNPEKSGNAVLDQFHHEKKTLLREMGATAAQIRLLAGEAVIEWHKPLKVDIITPPSLAEIIRWKGMAQGFNFHDHIDNPVLWVHGRVVLRGPTKQ
jgi:hypothetical protein